MPKEKRVKAYNMAVLDDDTAEINMYGEVVSVLPRDWRTNEPIPGYIGLDEFLNDLDGIKDKSQITVHINSGGGDLYAGLAIYNRLKNVKGTVTTVNDGLAASAASLIFQAGNVRKMNAGSNLMAHGVAGFLFGYYNIEELKEMVTEFKAHNRAIVNVYAERMGVTFDEAKHFVDGETWLTGQEAVDKGLADEVIEEEAEPEGDNNFINRIIQRARAAYGRPTTDFLPQIETVNTKIAVTAAAPTEDKNKNEGSNTMEIKNIEELRAAYPDLVAQAESAARTEGHTAGVSEERARIRGIEAIQGAIADQQMIAGAKYGDTPLTAEQLALKAMQDQAALGAQVLKNMAEDGAASCAEEVPAAPNAGPEGEPGAENDEAEAKEKIAEAVNLCNKIMNGGKKNGK